MTQPATGEEDWVAVTDAIRKRMRELKISTARLARESGLSETTIRYLGQSLSGHNKSTLVALSAVLRWRYDHLVNILHGEPEKNVHIRVPTGTTLERLVHDESAKLNQRLDSLAEVLDSIRWQLQRQQRLSEYPAPAHARNGFQAPVRLAAGKRKALQRKYHARAQLANKRRRPRKS